MPKHHITGPAARAALISATATAIAVLVGATAAARADDTLVATTAGILRGQDTALVSEFLGVPYAAPPVGALRWKPPQPASAWQGVRQATQFGSACAQPFGAFGNASTSEDCLFLNVYAPQGARANLPVMLWVHGGAFYEGEGSDYDGAALVRAGKVIVVTINYRLGFFGLLAHPALSAESPDHASGDYTLMDQQAALRWVHDNIASFGGNPANVTLFGESAGGQSTIDQLVSPSAANLFARAIIESGTYAVRIPTLSEAEARGTKVATALGCQTAACLRAIPTATLLAAEAPAFPKEDLSSLSSFVPNTGPTILPYQPTLAIGTGLFHHVPVLQGSNHDEARLFTFIGYDLQGMPITAATYQQAIAGVVGTTIAPLAAAIYPLANYASPDLAYSTFFTDSGFSCSVTALDTSLAQFTPVYAYEFADEQAARLLIPTDPFLNLGSAHATELKFIWPALSQVLSPKGVSFTADEQTLSTQMISAWTNFARSGNPNGAGVPAWARFSGLLGNVQELVPGATAPSLDFRHDHKCGFWGGLLGLDAIVPPSLLGGGLGG